MTTEVQDFAMDLLRELLAMPTAPYHEERVAARIAGYLRAWGIPYSVTDEGTIIAHYQSGAPTRPMALMAHMDHPGLEVTSLDAPAGADLVASLLGGVSIDYFSKATAVLLYSANPEQPAIAAHVHSATANEGHEITLMLTLDDPATRGSVQVGDFGVWDLPVWKLEDDLIQSRAIDDLVGCAAALLTIWGLAHEQRQANLYAVFTRAEEVGLVGAEVLLQQRTLPDDTYIVSLEASPALPGANQGQGPVIRVGDRVATFSQEAELPLKYAAYRLGSRIWRPGPEYPYATNGRAAQRQLMSGGRCEGSSAVLHGYLATGMAFPLGNYHNMGPDAHLAPEYIHQDDFINGILLLQEAARLMPEIDTLRAAHHTALQATATQIERLRATTGAIKDAARAD